MKKKIEAHKKILNYLITEVGLLCKHFGLSFFHAIVEDTGREFLILEKNGEKITDPMEILDYTKLKGGDKNEKED